MFYNRHDLFHAIILRKRIWIMLEHSSESHYIYTRKIEIGRKES